MIAIVISINFILYLLLLFKGSYSNDRYNDNSNTLEIAQHMSNSIITHDKELNYIDNNQHDISVNVIDKSNTIIDRMSSSDLSDKAKLLLLEESKHTKAFNFESFDTEYEHKTNHHHHQPPQQILQLSHHKEQQQHIDPIADINNFNIRFNDHRRLNNLPTEKKRIKRMVTYTLFHTCTFIIFIHLYLCKVIIIDRILSD